MHPYQTNPADGMRLAIVICPAGHPFPSIVLTVEGCAADLGVRKTMLTPTRKEEKIMTQDEKEWIDNASYEQLLRKWRNAPSGNPMFQGETGQYYRLVMAKRRNEIGPAEHVRASKNIG